MKATTKLMAFGFTGLLAALVGIGVALWQLAPPSAPVHGRRLQNPITLSDFTLAEADRAFALEDLKGRWSILSFGYSHCPDVCPTTLAYFRDELKRLANRSDLQFVFISVDPARDTPERLRTYVNFFDPAIRGVTGSEDELRRLTASLHTTFAREGEGETYSVAHAPQYFLVNPEGKVVALFSPPLAQGAIAEDLRTLSGKKGFLL